MRTLRGASRAQESLVARLERRIVIGVIILGARVFRPAGRRGPAMIDFISRSHSLADTLPRAQFSPEPSLLALAISSSGELQVMR